MDGGALFSTDAARRVTDTEWAERVASIISPTLVLSHTQLNEALLFEHLPAKGNQELEAIKLTRQILDQFRPLQAGSPDLLAGKQDGVFANVIKILESGDKRDGHDWHVRAELTLDILKELRQTKAGREQMHNLLGDMATFSGRVDVLREFLEYAGRKLNPYEAAKGLVIEVVHDYDQTRGYQTSSEPGASVSRPVALGSFGQPIGPGKQYLLYDPTDPSRKFLAKDDITVSTLIHFNATLRQGIEQATPRNIAAEVSARAGEHPTRLPETHSLKELFGDLYDKLDIARFENSSGESLSADAGYRKLSPREQRLIAIFQELQELKATLEKDVFRELGASGVLYLGSDKRLIEADPGGGLLHWYAKSIESGREFPDLVRAAYEAITDRSVAGTLSRAQRETYYDYLRGWRTMHDYTDSQPSLAPARQDYRTFQALRKLARKGALAAEHPMMTMEFDLDAQVVNSGLLTTTGDITFQERGRIVEDSGVRKVRHAVNAYTLSQFDTELFASLERFAPLFKTRVTEGESEVSRWREDCRGQSIPLGRLQESLLGANIIRDGSRTTSLLNVNEFREIEDALRLWDICRGDRQEFCGALSMKRFQQMVTSVIVSARKFDAMEYAIKVADETGKPILPDGATLELVGDTSRFSRIEIPTGRLYRRQHLVPCEELHFPENYRGEPKLMLEDFVRRALSGAQSGVFAGLSDRSIRELQVLGRVGLIDRAAIAGVERALPKVVDLVPVGDTWRSDIEIAVRAVKHPLVVVSKLTSHRVTECQIQLKRQEAGPWFQAGFLNPWQCEFLEQIGAMAGDPEVVKAGIDLRAEFVLDRAEQARLGELVRAAQYLEHQVAYEPRVSNERDIIMLGRQPLDPIQFGRRTWSPELKYFELPILEKRSEEVATQYYRWQGQQDPQMPRALREGLSRMYVSDSDDHGLIKPLRTSAKNGNLVRIPDAEK